MLNQILKNVKRMAYAPTRAERVAMADVILQQMTRIVQIEKYPLAVMALPNVPGITLGYSAEKLQNYTDAQLCTMLAHETQHIAADDLNQGEVWAAHRDWYGEWDGRTLFNVARDIQINDQLIHKLGMADLPSACVSDRLLGHQLPEAYKIPIEALMREVASKLKPPPGGDGSEIGSGDISDDAQEEMKTSAGRSPNTGEAGDVDLLEDNPYASKNRAGKPAALTRSPAQGNFDAFLAELIDTRKFTESWYKTPKRLMGVKEFATREFLVKTKTPLPRKTALIAIDVSGSMDESGVRRICEMVRGTPATYDLRVICFNSEVQEWTNFRTAPDMPMRGGGTNFEPVEEFAKSMIRYPDAVLVLTDGGAEVIRPNRPGVWTWVIYGRDPESFQKEFQMRTVSLESLVWR